MYEDPNYTLEEIMELLNRSEWAIRNKASRIGIKRPVVQYIGGLGTTEAIIYNEEKNTLIITAPVDADQVLDFICEILQNKARGGGYTGRTKL